MPEDLSTPDAQKVLRTWLGRKAEEAVKLLLDTKHLYQKVEIQYAETAQALHKRVYYDHKDDFARWVNETLPREQFVLELHLTDIARLAAEIKTAILLILPHLSLVCKKCGRREAFTPVWHADLISEIRAAIASAKSKPITLPAAFQMFSLVYQCQSCLGSPESFLVRREGWNLSLQGRSPMEQVEVPNFLPKIESRFYRDAVIAFNTGKTLAALFYLRTFIEQFARRVTNTIGRMTGEEILDAYYKTLLQKHADQMPSLREWYDKLSEAIHSANEDAALFEAAKPEIERHFDFRRIFGISEPKPIAAAGAVTENKTESAK
jgi:hypothetical protein